MLPVAIALLGTGLNRSTIFFMGWFGPRGLASIVLALVFLRELEHPNDLPIKLTVMATVFLSIYAHGLSARGGIRWYAKRV